MKTFGLPVATLSHQSDNVMARKVSIYVHVRCMHIVTLLYNNDFISWCTSHSLCMSTIRGRWLDLHVYIYICKSARLQLHNTHRSLLLTTVVTTYAVVGISSHYHTILWRCSTSHSRTVNYDKDTIVTEIQQHLGMHKCTTSGELRPVCRLQTRKRTIHVATPN